MRRYLGLVFPSGSLLVPALSCSFAAVYVVRRLRLQVQQLQDAKREPRALEESDSEVEASTGGELRENLITPSQRHLQQHLVNIVPFVRLRDAFIALPAASRWMHELFHEEILSGIKTNLLWPTEGFPPAPFLRDAPEPLLAPLEVLFLWSIRKSWAPLSHSIASNAPHRALQPPVARKAPGPILWTLERLGWSERGARALRQVLKWKADPDELDPNRWTPLIWAAHLGSVVIGRLLLRAGANPDHIGAEGSSALSVACRSAHKEVVQLLLLHKASPYLVPIGNGNFDHHVGDDILEMVRQYRKLSTNRGHFVLSSS